MGFPEDAHTMALKGHKISLEPFLSCALLIRKKYFNSLKILYEKERRMSMNTKIHSTSRRGFIKGMAVGAGAYAFGSSLIHPKEAMGQSIEGYLDTVPMRDRWSVAAGGVIFWQVKFLQTLLAKEGREKYIAYLKQNSRLIGLRGKGFADRFGFAGSDARSAAAIISATLALSYGPQHKLEIEGTTEKANVKCTNCVFWNAVQAQKITDDLCSVHSQEWWNGFANAINPKLNSNLVKARPLGDSVCEWVIELKA
jgi:hypothetical protein